MRVVHLVVVHIDASSREYIHLANLWWKNRESLPLSSLILVSSKYGTDETVKARFWPWRSGERP